VGLRRPIYKILSTVGSFRSVPSKHYILIPQWSESRVWNAALDGVQVVVSTHAILLDALTHGFVKMTSLALLVFDEGTTLSH
jgi:uncharacterized membrane protein YagU involved in acid resistance